MFDLKEGYNLETQHSVELPDFAVHFQAAEFARDAFRFYEAYRSAEPVSKSAIANATLVFGYEDVIRCYEDPRICREPVSMADYYGKEVSRILRHWLQWFDGEAHDNRRQLVGVPFSVGSVRGLKPAIEAVAKNLLSDIGSAGQCDLMKDFAFPLPVLVICQILGFPLSDYKLFLKWAPELYRILDPIKSPAQQQSDEALMLEIEEYIVGIMDKKLQQPGDDMISYLLNTELPNGFSLSREAIVAHVFLMFFAGHETTANALVCGMFELLQHPEQLRLLRSSEKALKPAVEEFIRFTSPVQTMLYAASDDLTLGGVDIQRGEYVWLMLASANRDERVFPNPDQFDICRWPNPHLGFGRSPHSCLGNHLSRLELSVAIRALLDTFSSIQLCQQEPRWRFANPLRLLESVQVEVSR